MNTCENHRPVITTDDLKEAAELVSFNPWQDAQARHAQNNPWTATDEERIKRKHDAEQAELAAWQAAHADEPCEDEQDEEGEE